MVNKPRIGDASFDFNSENLRLLARSESTEEGFDSEPGTSAGPTRTSRKRVRVESDPTSGIILSLVNF